MTGTLEIFRTGRHTSAAGTTLPFSEADVREISNSYDPAAKKASLVKGHPQTDDPAYGWVAGLQFDEGSGKLLAVPDQVDPVFAAEVNDGRYKYISLSLYLREHPSNPKPGKFYLKHVGLLGVTAPAAKGLAEARFSEDEEAGIAYFQSPLSQLRSQQGALGMIADMFKRVREKFIETDGVESANQIIPEFAIDELRDVSRQPIDDPEPIGLAEEAVMKKDGTDEAAFAEREKALKDREAELTAKEQSIAESAKAATAKETTEYVEGLVTAGKILPRQASTLTATLVAIDGAAPVEFADGTKVKKVSPQAVIRELLDALPEQVNYSELAAPDGVDMGQAVALRMGLPANAQVDPDRARLHAQAEAYSEQHKVDYMTAVNLVARQRH